MIIIIIIRILLLLLLLLLLLTNVINYDYLFTIRNYSYYFNKTI